MNKLSVILAAAIVSMALISAASDAAMISVCSSGCNSSTVQGGINMAVDGDSVQIIDSLHYNESLVVNRSINLTSNFTSAPTLFSQNLSSTINVTVGNVSISRLLVIYNGTGRFQAIESRSTTNLTIYNSTIRTNGTGGYASPIFLRNVNQSLIERNTISSTSTGTNNIGINLTGSSMNNITLNVVSTSAGSTSNYGVAIYSGSNSNNISYNNITGGGTSSGNNGVDMSSSSSNSITYNTIISASSGGNAQTVSLSSSTYNYIANNFIRFAVSNGGCRGIRVSSSNNNTIENNYLAGDRVSNSNMGMELSSSSNLTIRGNNVTAKGFFSSTTGISLSSVSGSRIENNNISTQGPGSAVVISMSSSSSNNITNNNITASTEAGGGNHGVSLSSSSSNLFTGNNITTRGSDTDYGIRFTGTSTNNNVTNSVINATLAADIRDENTGLSSNFLFNNTFNGTDISFSATSIGKIFMQWKLNVMITNGSGTPMSDVVVILNDTNNSTNSDNPSSNFTQSTNSSGQIGERLVMDYMANRTYNSSNGGVGYLYFNNYTINSTINKYERNSSIFNLTSTNTINMSMRKIFANITFTQNSTFTTSSVPVSLTLLEGYNLSMSIDGQANTTVSTSNGTFAESVSGLSNGLHNVTFYAVGLVSSDSETIFFTVNVPEVTAEEQISSNNRVVRSSVSLEEDRVKVTIPGITPLKPKSVEIDKENVPVTEIEISVNDVVRDVRIFIGEAGKPAVEVDAKVYSYMEIEKENVDDHEISSAKIKFEVSRDWIRSNYVNPEFIKLYRLHQDSWDQLPTNIASIDDRHYIYEAETPGFSTFAIAARPLELHNVTLGDTVPEKAIEEAVNQVIEATRRPTETPWKTILTLAFFAAAVASVFYLSYTKMKVHEHVRKYRGETG